MSIQETLKKNITLIIGLLIPVLMVAFVAISVYVPRLGTSVVPPQYGFLYTLNDQYQTEYQYRIASSTIVKEKVDNSKVGYVPSSPVIAGEPQLFLYDPLKDVSTEISFADAQKLTLKSGAISPDGYEVVSQNNGGGFPFSAPYDYWARYLKKDTYYKKMALGLGESDSWKFQFLAWVVTQ